MNIQALKKEYIGKKLLSVIDVNLRNDSVVSALKRMTGDEYDRVNQAKVLLFENNKALVFVDFDSDGYRSGEWHLIHIKEMLDKKQTKGIKMINSIVKNIEYFKNTKCVPESYSGEAECILITTNEYVIKMGQNNSDSYYPHNFFDLEECKEYVLGITKYEKIDRK